MTYQVTVLGSDGLVMASDRCEAWRDQGGRAARTTNAVRKVYIRKNAAWTFSGGNLSGIAAHYLDAALGATVTEESAEAMLKQCGNQAATAFSYNPTVTDVVVMAIAGASHLLRAHVSKQTAIMRIEDGKFISGDADNLASFFPQIYYDKHKSVNELARIASFAVCMAHEFNQQHVQGLDLAIYRNSVGEFKFEDSSAFSADAQKLRLEIENCFKQSSSGKSKRAR